MTDVQGRCPACRAASLFLGAGGHVTCARIDCPHPTLADEQMHGEHVDAVTELARLHEGEETTEGHDPAAVHSNGQWLYRFNRAEPAERLQVIEALRTEAARGSNCFLMAHEKRLSEPSQTAVNKAADCADIVFTRHRGQAITIDGPAPAHTRIALHALMDRYAYLHMPTPDTIVFADQVVYKVTAYRDGALDLELVEDWRPAVREPKCAVCLAPVSQHGGRICARPGPVAAGDPVSEEEYEALKAKWQREHGNGQAVHLVEVHREEESGA